MNSPVCSDGENQNTDIFIHYSAIRSILSHYTYLVQGEYVDFTLTKVTDNTNTFQACDLTGHFRRIHQFCRFGRS